MKLSTSLVAVKKITSTIPRSSFANDELEQVARLILKAEGVINPIVLRRTSLESYEVVDGDFEYYAAARAREIDPRKGEMIGAFIMESEKEEFIKEQIKALRKQKPAGSSNGNFSSDGVEVQFKNMESRFTSIESRLTNLESRLENRFSELNVQMSKIQNMDNRLKEVESRIPEPIKLLDALNTLSLSDLTSKLRGAGVNSTTIEKIVSERDKDKFKSFRDVVERVKGLGDKTMVKILDSFSEGVN